MQKEDVWAVDPDRITAFFQEQPDAVPVESGFAFPGCRIAVTALESRRMAGMALPQTRVVFEGEDTAVSAVYKLFLLRFLSAGG